MCFFFFYFCYDNGSLDGRDVQVGLIDRMVYYRHVGGVLVFSVCGVWFSLQDLLFFPTHFVTQHEYEEDKKICI
jgi:hypothetical protein